VAWGFERRGDVCGRLRGFGREVLGRRLFGSVIRRMAMECKALLMVKFRRWALRQTSWRKWMTFERLT
jgi:hypothetical protein